MTPETTVADEIAEMYEQLAPALRRILAMNVGAPDWVLDDACQMAWAALLARPERIDRSRLLGWLATTARREAVVLLRRSRCELCLDQAAVGEVSGAAPGPEESVEFWERLGQVRRLSRRQQRIVWMQSLGFEYTEIAARTGESRRSVERQLVQARRRLKAVA